MTETANQSPSFEPRGADSGEQLMTNSTPLESSAEPTPESSSDFPLVNTPHFGSLALSSGSDLGPSDNNFSSPKLILPESSDSIASEPALLSPRLKRLPNIPKKSRVNFSSVDYAVTTYKILNFLSQPLSNGQYPQLLIGQTSNSFPTLAHLKHLGISTNSQTSTILKIPSWLLSLGIGDLVFILWPSPSIYFNTPSFADTKSPTWFKGMFNGKLGYFPSDSVTILDPNLFTLSSKGLNLISLTTIPASLTISIDSSKPVTPFGFQGQQENTPQTTKPNTVPSQSTESRSSSEEFFGGFKSAHPDARGKKHLDHTPLQSPLSSYVPSSAPLQRNTLNRSLSLSVLSGNPKSASGAPTVPRLRLDRFSTINPEVQSRSNKKWAFLGTLTSPRRKPKKSLYDSKTLSLTNLDSILHSTSSPAANIADPLISPRGNSIPELGRLAEFQHQQSESQDFGPGLASLNLSPRRNESLSPRNTASGRSGLIPFPRPPRFVSHASALSEFHSRFSEQDLVDARNIPLPSF